MYHSYSVFSTLLKFALFSSCSLANPMFNTPPASGTGGDFSLDPIYNEGSNLEVSWANAGFQRYNLVLYQAASGLNNVLASNLTDTSYNWTVTWKDFRNLTNYEDGKLFPAYIMYLQVFDADNNANTFSSHYFNVSDPASFPSVTVNASPSSSSITGTASAISATSKPSDIALAQNNPSSNSLSSGAKAGIGIGVIIGVFALAGAGYAAFALGRRRATARWKEGGNAGPVNELSNTEAKKHWWTGSVSSGSSASTSGAATIALAPGGSQSQSSQPQQSSDVLDPPPSSQYQAAELADGGRFHAGAAHEVNAGIPYFEMPAQQQNHE